jgi:HemK-like putative methylase
MIPVRSLLGSLPAKKRADGEWLLMEYFRCSRAELFLGEKMLAADLERRWKKDWARRSRGEPLQYIVGSAPFYGRDFLVKPGVLIPRPETESLVELTLNLGRGMDAPAVLDLCTGSGAVGISLKLERPSWMVTGTDISSRALAVAKKNSKMLGGAVELKKANLFSPALRAKRWDIVVSNPPYLEYGKDFIARDVKKWEPRLALEPSAKAKVKGITRAAWCAERILESCAVASVKFTALELSPRVSIYLFARWKKHPKVSRIWREADLAGRKRFLLVEWSNA